MNSTVRQARPIRTTCGRSRAASCSRLYCARHHDAMEQTKSMKMDIPRKIMTQCALITLFAFSDCAYAETSAQTDGSGTISFHGNQTAELFSKELDESLKGVIENRDRKSTRLNSSHQIISYAVFCLKKKKIDQHLGDLHQSDFHSSLNHTNAVPLERRRAVFE